ncbi:hypothetical protein BRADI_3g54621v3, partial [Brachypodium distachyon]
DETLVLAWEAITLDAILGVEQSGSTYWQRIHEHYHQIKKTSGDRTQKSLTNRWSAIQDTCNKWASAMEQVERLNPSGTNQNDRLNIIAMLCFSMMRSGGHEMMRCQTRRASPQATHILLMLRLLVIALMRVAPRVQKEAYTKLWKKRPLGRKKEKARLKKEKESSCKDFIEMIVATRKSLAAERKEKKARTFMQIRGMEKRRIAFEAHRVLLEERRIAIEERQEKNKQEKRELMFMNSSNLDDQGKAHLKLMRDQIMASKPMCGFMLG